MKFSDVENNIGEEVVLNGHGDLAMCEPFRTYLRPDVIPPVFKIVKVTRGGRVQIQTDNGMYLTVNCSNINLPN